MRLPSDDQTGWRSGAGSNVNRVGVPVLRSICQTSWSLVFSSFRMSATFVPSGDTLIVPYGPGAAAVPAGCPCRVYHVGCNPAFDSVKYASVPVSDVEK